MASSVRCWNLDTSQLLSFELNGHSIIAIGGPRPMALILCLETVGCRLFVTLLLRSNIPRLWDSHLSFLGETHGPDKSVGLIRGWLLSPDASRLQGKGGKDTFATFKTICASPCHLLKNGPSKDSQRHFHMGRLFLNNPATVYKLSGFVARPHSNSTVLQLCCDR